MPLIDITIKPGVQLKERNGSPFSLGTSRPFLHRVIGPELPGLFVRHRTTFGMDNDTPKDAVQVMFHNFTEHDINVPDVWMKVQFTEEQTDERSRHFIRDAVFKAIVELFHRRGANMPDNFVLDVFWGPTHGCGTVNGSYIEW